PQADLSESWLDQEVGRQNPNIASAYMAIPPVMFGYYRTVSLTLSGMYCIMKMSWLGTNQRRMASIVVHWHSSAKGK
ncbi:MAG: hypothetical protein LKI45_11905, partial [Schleiferilactobacillus harbinensis]|nr:hypothetical protein [Schleiferilactobacillus harbinensis]